MRRSSRFFVVAGSSALLAGCSGDGPPPLQQSDLPGLVLQVEDLGPVWQEFDRGRQARSDAFLGKPVDTGRFGRVGGWKARYRRPGPSVPAGPLVVESKADLFESANGATRELERMEALLRETFADARIERPSGFGDEALVAAFAQGSGRFGTQFVVVVWRAENAAAALVLTGVRGLTVADALELGRKQQRRIARAAQ